jgi:hypothetical protein
MRYTVASTPLANHQLADIWLRAANPQDVTDASDRIEAALRNDPDRLGELRRDGRRVIVLPPLSVTFEVSVDDRRVTIVSIRYRP